MCGIAGYIGRFKIEDERIRRTLELMVHRGPDCQDFKTLSIEGLEVALLHSRLSIIDLQASANQPFSRNGYTLIFNGEIYNYKELRVELERGGYQFTTESDTEVLFALLEKEGPTALSQCIGMWSLAFLNESTGELTLARDRFGEKPLHMLELPEGIAFGSEVKFISELTGKRLSVNIPHLLNYILKGYRTVQKPETKYFRNLHQIPAGCFATISPDQPIKIQRYWTPSFTHQEECTYKEAVKEFRKQLERSLELCLRADVPTAFALSGGVDSTALVSLAVKVFGQKVSTFTVANTDRDYDERDMVKATVAELGTEQHWVPVPEKGFVEYLTELIHKHDAPLSTITFMVQAKLLEQVAEAGYRVVISGVGADELLSGYYDHHLAYLHDLSGTEYYEEALQSWKTHVKPLIRNPLFHDPEFFTKNPMRVDHLFTASDTVRAMLRNPYDEVYMQGCFHSDVLRNRMFNELFFESVPVFLAEDDLNAMAVSVENRSPFLNHNVAESCFKIPTRHLVQGGMAKSILRDAVRDVAPHHVIDCKEKVGFNAALASMIDLGSAETAEMYLSDTLLFDYFSRDALQSLLKEPERARKESMFLFNFLNAKIFLEHYC